MNRLAKAVTLVLALGVTHTAAAVTVADWTDQTSGSLNSTSFTTTGFSGFGDIRVGSYTGPDYAAAPAPIAEALQYGANSDWTVTFSSPLSELLETNIADHARDDVSRPLVVQILIDAHVARPQLQQRAVPGSVALPLDTLERAHGDRGCGNSFR